MKFNLCLKVMFYCGFMDSFSLSILKVAKTNIHSTFLCYFEHFNIFKNILVKKTYNFRKLVKFFLTFIQTKPK